MGHYTCKISTLTFACYIVPLFRFI